MIINQSNLHGLTTGYSAAFNKALSEVSPDYKDIATVTSSSTAANDYAWLGQIPGMKEWIGDREVQHISEYGYTIKNKSFERTIGINRDAIEDDQYGIRYKNAITFLTNVAKGLANIDTGQDTADGSGTATANDGFRYQANERLFSRETMKGY